MNKIKAIFKKLSKPTLIGIVVFSIIIIAVVFISSMFYMKTSQVLDTNLRERLLSIVTTAVVEFNPHDIEQLRVENDWTKPEWAKVVHQMEKIRKNNSNIVYIYMFRKTDADPTKMEFVSDSHSIDPYVKIDTNNDGVVNNEDQLQWPGQPYDVSDIPETFEAYNGPTTNKKVYSDQWGSFLTGYAPIKNENGKVVAILAVDIKAGDFAIIKKQTLQPFLIFIALLLLISIIPILILVFVHYKSIFKKFTKPTLTGTIVLFISIIIIIFTSWILYSRTVDILTQNLRDRLLTISITQAANIDTKDLEALQIEDDWKKSEWARVVNKLHKAKYNNKDIVFMYIIRKTKDDSKKIEFVADADSVDPYANTSGDLLRYIDVNRDGKIEPDGPDKLQWPGQLYDGGSDIPEIYEAYNGPIAVKDLYTDEYGTVLTGYAPIKDENGNTVAILGTDIKADSFFTITRQTLRPFLIFIGFLSSIISILILVIIYSWRKYDKYLQELYKKEVKQRIEIEHLLKIKSEFIGVVSHQLRTPVSVIKGMSSMLKDGDLDNEPKEKKDRFITGIFEKSEKLADILDDILKAEELDMDNFTFIPANMKSVNLSQIIKGIFDDLVSLAKEKKLNYQININPEVANLNLMTDDSFLKHVFQNIIDNAIKYSRENGRVAIDLSRDNDYFICKIIDSGIGVSEDQKDRLFEKFFRARNAVDTYAYGTGLGLFIARKIIEAHPGGKIWFESVVNSGTTFYIKLPIAIAK